MLFQGYFYYPSNFDLEKFCLFYNFEGEKVAKFLNFLTAPQNVKNFKRTRKLNASILNDIIGKDYANIIRALIQDGIIENTEGYEIGSHSRSYQLSDDYFFLGVINSF